MSETAELHYKEQLYKVRIIKEWRGSSRYSLGSKFLTIRVPKFMPPHLIEFHEEEARQWAMQQIEKRIESNQYPIQKHRKYIDQTYFEIGERSFKIHVLEKNIKNFSGKVVADRLILKIPMGESGDHETLGTLVSRIMGHHFHPYILDKVETYNNEYFKETINKVRLKNNKSNWGSCSSDNNLNFSTRLLFAPEEVINYVIVHELAHLKEMNHSPAYWKIVKSVMPEYKKQEKWLKKNHHLCYF